MSWRLRTRQVTIESGRAAKAARRLRLSAAVRAIVSFRVLSEAFERRPSSIAPHEPLPQTSLPGEKRSRRRAVARGLTLPEFGDLGKPAPTSICCRSEGFASQGKTDRRDRVTRRTRASPSSSTRNENEPRSFGGVIFRFRRHWRKI